MINGSLINGASINGASNSVINETLTETLSIIFKGGPSVSEGLSSDLSLISSSTSKEVFKNVISELLVLNSTLAVKYINSIIESLSITDSSLYKVKLKEGVLESVITSLITTDSFSFRNSITDTLTFLDLSQIALSHLILDSIILNDIISFHHKLNHLVTEVLEAVDSSTINSLYILDIQELVNTDDDLVSSAVLKETINNLIVITIGDTKENNTYLAYALSPESMSVSTYSNYNFTCSCKFDDKYLFGNSIGLYEYGGITDDGATIRSEMETVAYNFDTSNLKQVPYLYLGVDSTDNFILKVRVDGKGEILYKLNKYTNNLMTQKVDIGKGLIGRYFQFEIITEADEFNLESIEYCPLIIRRKI